MKVIKISLISLFLLFVSACSYQNDSEYETVSPNEATEMTDAFYVMWQNSTIQDRRAMCDSLSYYDEDQIAQILAEGSGYEWEPEQFKEIVIPALERYCSTEA